VVKQEEVKELLYKYHDDPLFGAHQGRDKMVAALQKEFYWRGMKLAVEEYLKNCAICVKYKPQVVKPPLTPIVATKPLERWIIDFCEVSDQIICKLFL
jgi:hypothetical protein